MKQSETEVKHYFMSSNLDYCYWARLLHLQQRRNISVELLWLIAACKFWLLPYKVQPLSKKIAYGEKKKEGEKSMHSNYNLFQLSHVMYIKKYKWNSSGMKALIFYIEICFFKKISVLKRFLKADSSWVKTFKTVFPPLSCLYRDKGNNATFSVQLFLDSRLHDTKSHVVCRTLALQKNFSIPVPFIQNTPKAIKLADISWEAKILYKPHAYFHLVSISNIHISTSSFFISAEVGRNQNDQ